MIMFGISVSYCFSFNYFDKKLWVSDGTTCVCMFYLYSLGRLLLSDEVNYLKSFDLVQFYFFFFLSTRGTAAVNTIPLLELRHVMHLGI